MTMTTNSAAAATANLSHLREAQMALTAAIAHAREEALEPEWKDRLLGVRLLIEKRIATVVEQELAQAERS
jgi:hypothetical protein